MATTVLLRPRERSAVPAPRRRADAPEAGRLSALIAGGVITGLWLQACAAARSDEVIAARCQAVIVTILDETDTLSSAGPEAVTADLARATLVLTKQAVGMDISEGIDTALRTLRTIEANSSCRER